MKTILKVLYIAIMAVFGVFMFLATYNNAGYSVYSGYVSEALTTGKYEQLGKCLALFGIPYDPVYQLHTEDGTTAKTVILNEMFNLKVTYTEEGNSASTTYSKAEDTYFICIINPDYDISNVDGDTVGNQTAIRFYSGEKYYDFLMVRSADVNADSYISSPTSLSEAIQNDARECTSVYSAYDLYFINITNALMKEINTALGGTVDSYNLINNVGKTVYKENVPATLDFSQQYFSDNDEWQNAYNITLDDDNDVGDWTDEEVDAASEFIETYDPKEIGGGIYAVGYLQKEIYTGKCIGQSIGYEVLYLVCVALIYILLFKFKKIRGLIDRITNRGKTPVRQAPRQARPVTAPTTIERHRESAKSGGIQTKPLEISPEAPEAETKTETAPEAKPEETKASEPEVVDAEVEEPKEEFKDAETVDAEEAKTEETPEQTK